MGFQVISQDFETKVDQSRAVLLPDPALSNTPEALTFLTDCPAYLMMLTDFYNFCIVL